MISLAAFGGVGKSALLNRWLDRLRGSGWQGAERVFGWSFYSQGTREDAHLTAMGSLVGLRFASLGHASPSQKRQ